MTNSNDRRVASDPEAVTSHSRSHDKPTVRLTAHSVPRWAVIGIFLLLLVAGIAYARVFLIPVVLAFLLALVFSPVRRFLERSGLPSGLAALLIVGSLGVGLAAGALVVADPLTGWLADAPEIGRRLEDRARSLLGPARSVIRAGRQISEIATGSARGDVQEVVVQEPGMVSLFAFQAPAILAQTVFMLVLLLFLLSSGDMFYEKLVHVLPTFKDKRRAMRIAYDVERKLSRYLFTITLINAGLGCAVGTAMWLIGMPNPVLFGVMAFTFNYVPYLGALCGLTIAAIVGFVTFDYVGYALLAAAVYFALTTIEGQLVTPHLVGRQLEMNTVAVFLAIAFWAWLWSVLGMLVAVPLLVTVRAFCDHIPQLGPVGDFLSARGSEQADDQNDAVRP